jgi:hypothetical protein
VDPQVAQTLVALERKLGDLERELNAIGGREPNATGERGAGAGAAGRAQSVGGGAPGSAEERVERPIPPTVLVDEAVEQRFSMEARETVYGEIPATKDERQTIELAELVRFRETMRRTLDGLIEEYSRLLSLKPPSDA